MGSKRCFDEEFPVLPCKHLRKLEHSNTLNPFVELVPCENAPQELIFSGRNRWIQYFIICCVACLVSSAVNVTELSIL